MLCGEQLARAKTVAMCDYAPLSPFRTPHSANQERNRFRRHAADQFSDPGGDHRRNLGPRDTGQDPSADEAERYAI
jgi:hypothetical protein